MAVLRDWECKKCENIFEAWDDNPQCPCGSKKLVQVFLKAPGMLGQRTKVSEALLTDIINSYGFTDYNNNPSTMHESTRFGTPPKEDKGISVKPTGESVKLTMSKKDGVKIDNKSLKSALERIQASVAREGYKGQLTLNHPTEDPHEKYRQLVDREGSALRKYTKIGRPGIGWE